MKIAMAVKTKSIESAVAPLFGKAKYFAIINSDTNEIEIVENVSRSGIGAVELLLSKNVNIILMSHMGEKPFSIALSRGIEVYYLGDERITTQEALEKLNKNELPIAKNIDSGLFFKHGKHEHHDHENNH